MSETSESRKISDLKVPELRSELEKRDLDKSGIKAILLERLQNALLEDGEDPENFIFDESEKSLVSEKNSKSPSVEKKLAPVIEKKDSKTVTTTDKKPTTPTKTVKANVVGRRPGPKSKTCVPQVKTDKNNSSNLRKKNDEVKQEQPDSSNVVVIANSEDTKKVELDTSISDITDSNEAEAKEMDADELNEAEGVDIIPFNTNETKIDDDESNQENMKELENDEIIVIPINCKNTDILIEKVKCNEIKTKSLDNFDINEEDDVKEESIENNGKVPDKEKHIISDNVVSALKEIVILDDDNIQDEELDHEVDEEEIKSSTDFTNDTEKSIQENNKDDNNEDSINLTIGEDDIKLFADEEDTNIEKEDEVIENCTKEDISMSKVRESRHPVTASSGRSTTGSAKSRRSATEKRSSVGDKPRSSHKEDKDNSNAKPIISVSVPKDEKKEEEKQVKDKVETGNKQSNETKNPQISNDASKKNNTSLVRNIWVSGLSSITKATDLKQLFSKYGKVVGAKVVTNAKTPGARCYGFVTLSSAEDANRSIEHLHQTELHGRVISVERAKRDNGYQQTAKNSDNSKINETSEAERKNKKPEEKKDKREEKREKRPEITINDVDKKPDVSKDRKRSLSKDRSQEIKRSKIVIEREDRRKDRSVKSKSNERDREKLRELERERERLEREKRRQQEILNFTKMKTERERQKQKEQERSMREEERKRRIEKERQLEIERKQKEEAIRLEKERQKLRIERERIEKEKAELLRLERENQRLERERLQREKEELRRAQEKLEETKRQAVLKRAMPPSPPMPSKRHSSSSSRYDDRKEPVRSSRVQPGSDYISQAAPPPPNITSSRHRYEQHSSDSRRSRPSPPPPPPPAARPKDSTVSMRYGAPPPTDHHYRSRDDRSDRREESRRKESSGGNSNRHAHTSYDSNKSSYGMSRNSENNAWPSAPVKSSYSSLGSNSGSSMLMSTRPDPWTTGSSSREIETTVWQRPPQPPTDNRWNSASSNPSSMSLSGRNSSSNTLYVNNHQVLPPNMGLNMSTNYSDNRFDSYKMSGMSRKY